MNLVYLFTAAPGTALQKEYFFDTDTLLGRKEQISVSVAPVEKYSQTYHPARITYTGITIGCVHTGSINVQDEYFSLGASRTGKGKVQINGLDPYTILLSDELLEIAKQNPILKNKISGKELRLRGEGRRVSEAEMLNMLRGNDVMGSNDFLNSQADACYTMDFCACAADFIANALDGKFLTEQQRQSAASSLLDENKPEFILVGELLYGYNQPKSTELINKAIDTLLNKENAEGWYLVKNYLEKNGGEKAKELIEKIDEKLSSKNKYEIDGKTFYDKEKYNEYVRQKEWERIERESKIKVAIISTISILFIGACGLILLMAMGIF